MRNWVGSILFLDKLFNQLIIFVIFFAGLSLASTGVYPIYHALSTLPNSYIRLYHTGHLHPRAVELLCRGLIFNDPLLEDFSRPSAWEVVHTLQMNMSSLLHPATSVALLYQRDNNTMQSLREKISFQNISLQEIDSLRPHQIFSLLLKWLGEKANKSSTGGLTIALLALRLVIRKSDVPLTRNEALALTTALFCQNCVAIPVECVPAMPHIHLIAQFQVGMLIISVMNQLLLCPLPDLNPRLGLDGPAMHFYLRKAEMSKKNGNALPLCSCREDVGRVDQFTLFFQKVMGGLEPFLADA